MCLTINTSAKVHIGQVTVRPHHTIELTQRRLLALTMPPSRARGTGQGGCSSNSKALPVE
ncbi:MAG: hypothetical protein H6656_18355 [Ardenticatenaceae bacterium]|nr:hypothetical protein [Ardenticatenaceae bacterium]